MSQKVVITYGKFRGIEIEEAILRNAGYEVVSTYDMDPETAFEEKRTADALMVGIDLVPADLIAAMDRCRIICRSGTGYDAIDVDAATRHGIWVTNMPDYAIDEVSAHAIALMMAQARHLFPHRQQGRHGIWKYRSETPIRRLADQTLGHCRARSDWQERGDRKGKVLGCG